MNQKKCINCKHYNSDRRNEEGLARCSRYPFWVKSDETCEGFESDYEVKEILEIERTQPIGRDKEDKSERLKGVFKAFPLSVLGLVEIYLIYGLTFLAIGLVFWLLLRIPALSTLVNWLFRIRKDTPDVFATFMSTMLSCYLFIATANRIIKSEYTKRFTMMYTGICLTVLNIALLILNLTYNSGILINILFLIAGLVIFYEGKSH